MAKVYTGKIAIPGERIGEFVAAMEAAEKAREPFRQSLVALNEEFHAHLVERFSERTARKHSSIVELFIEFLCRQTDAGAIDEITRGMVNTHFRAWYKRKVWDSATPNDLRVALKKFFEFLASEKGIEHPKILQALRG
jgi:site-specific recombinase XerD